MKRVQTYTASGITVGFDPSLCIHSAVCLRSLPAVFDVRRKRWVAPEAASAEAVAETIRRCPSGALTYTFVGAAEPADDAPAETAGASIQASLDGPLLVAGSFRLVDETGAEIPAPGRVALCRCGGTKNAPFCDGTHRVNGFHPRREP